MCLIIHRQTGGKLDMEMMETAITDNPDGFALSYHVGNSLQVVRGLRSFYALTYMTELEKQDIEFVCHLRLTTHGLTDLANCHGFPVRNFVLFHNGIFNINCDTDTTKSDTWHFCRMLERVLPKKPKSDDVKDAFKVFESIIGQSKVTVMFDDGEVFTWNDRLGVEEDKVWYSNLWSAWTYNPKHVPITDQTNDILWFSGDALMQIEEYERKGIYPEYDIDGAWLDNEFIPYDLDGDGNIIDYETGKVIDDLDDNYQAYSERYDNS